MNISVNVIYIHSKMDEKTTNKLLINPVVKYVYFFIAAMLADKANQLFLYQPVSLNNNRFQ